MQLNLGAILAVRKNHFTRQRRVFLIFYAISLPPPFKHQFFKHHNHHPLPNSLNKHIMDRQSVYSLSVLAPDYSENNEDSRRQVQTQLQNFILEFRLENSFIYR